MNVTVLNMLESLVSVEAPTLDCPGQIARSQTQNAACKPAKHTPLACERPIVNDLFFNDLRVVEEMNEEEPASPGREDRRSPRYSVPLAQQPCVLEIDANALPASLVDMSEGGFAVLVERLEGLKIGKQIKLKTDMGCFTVHITYINEVAPPKKATSDADCYYRLGMKKSRKSFLSRLLKR